jgi:NADPH:quinone reductase-like Zn-dependent oxidoreductase
MIRAGTYIFRAMLPKPPVVLGSDVAGVVASVGSEVRRFRPGDRVFAMQPSSDGFGGYAEYAAVRESAVAPLPADLDFVSAAGIPLAGLTALQAIRDDGRFRADQSIVITAAVGGVGHYGVQIAKALGAGRIVGVCSAANHELARELGCDEVIDYREQDYTRTVKGIDLVFDAIGRGSLAKARPVLAEGGSYVTTIPSPGRAFDSLRTRLWPFGRRSRMALVRSNSADLELLARWATEGRLRTVVDRVEPLDGARALHDHSRSFRTRGKNILRVRD